MSCIINIPVFQVVKNKLIEVKFFIHVINLFSAYFVPGQGCSLQTQGQGDTVSVLRCPLSTRGNTRMPSTPKERSTGLQQHHKELAQQFSLYFISFRCRAEQTSSRLPRWGVIAESLATWPWMKPNPCLQDQWMTPQATVSLTGSMNKYLPGTCFIEKSVLGGNKGE